MILSMISNPNICNKKWIYEQFDHEVGIRTVLKPGFSDSSVLKLDNEKFISCTLDGNSKHCYIDPYNGTLGILSESIRNTICVGATPIGIVDHLQFGNPENEQIFWTFLESIRAIRDFCKIMKIPVVGGKVSLYNEIKNGPIKPSPVIGALGIINNKKSIRSVNTQENDSIFIIGLTAEEMGGSEYYEYHCKIIGGKVPIVNLKDQLKILNTIKCILNKNLASAIHDCSKGGFIIALLELSIQCNLGFNIDIGKIPTTCKRIDYILFSESHNRFILSTKFPSKIKNILKEHNIPFANIGNIMQNKDCNIKFLEKTITTFNLSEIAEKYDNSLSNYLQKDSNII